VSRKCGPQGRRHHSAWRRKSARLAVPFFSLPRLPGPAPGTTSVPARLRRRHVSKFRLGPTNLSTMFPSSGLRRTHLGAAVGATESVEHWFVIGTTVAQFLGPPTTRREVRIRAHKPSSACAITGPTSVDLASGPRWRTCVARLHHGDLPAEPSRRNLTHRRSGRRRTCEHGVARHHRTDRAAEVWLSSSPMAGPEDAEDAGPRRSPFRSPRSGPARGSRWAARLARSRRRRPHVGSPRHRKPVVAVVTPMRSTARASVRSPPHRGSRAHRRP
jgi:hypothetical protein